jgi:hypothetical protein
MINGPVRMKRVVPLTEQFDAFAEGIDSFNRQIDVFE